MFKAVRVKPNSICLLFLIPSKIRTLVKNLGTYRDDDFVVIAQRAVANKKCRQRHKHYTDDACSYFRQEDERIKEMNDCKINCIVAICKSIQRFKQ